MFTLSLPIVKLNHTKALKLGLLQSLWLFHKLYMYSRTIFKRKTLILHKLHTHVQNRCIMQYISIQRYTEVY